MQAVGSWIIFTQEVLKEKIKKNLCIFMDELTSLKLKVKVSGNWPVTPFLPYWLNHWDLSTDWGGWSDQIRSDDTSQDS